VRVRRNQKGWCFVFENFTQAVWVLQCLEAGTRKAPSRLGHRPAQHGQKFVRTSHKTIPQALDSSGFLDVSRKGFISSRTANGLSRRDIPAINLSKVTVSFLSWGTCVLGETTWQSANAQRMAARSDILSQCAAATKFRGESSLLRNISTPTQEWKTGARATTSLPPSRSQSSGRIRRNLAGNYP
jgi:hypothetical protein